jgi:CRISPR-associated endonuclease/helicase Cas3
VQENVRDLSTSTDGTLSILESATGSGKTEAALGRFARLLEAGLVDSLYFAVPTRAAAKQLYERVKTARDRIFDKKDPPVHLAVPGYLKVDDVEGTRFGWDVRWDEDVGPRGWAAESSKRYTASPIAVGTLDQVLMSALQRKHAHLRLAGLARSLLVVDEVHASSIYMNEALKTVLSFHREKMGGHALLMSATLGSKARAAFIGEDAPSLAEAKRQHYPLISHVSGVEGKSETAEPDAPEGRDKAVTLALEGIMKENDAAAVARRAEKAARTGAHVLVIRNTVKACQAVHRALDDAWSLRVNEKATPHHSRYGADDRELLDDEIERVYGKNEIDGRPTRPHTGGVVTVATQTVEQSLDIDADYLITDLCPMDVLLQRIGRLHRHQREGDRSDGYREARCCVLVPEAQVGIAASISEDTGKGFPGPGLGSVYPDLRIIEATRRTLAERVAQEEPIVIPRDNRTLVEEATHPEVIDAFESSDARWGAHARHVRTKGREEALGARNVLIGHDEPFTSDGNQFPTERPKTRLGQEDVVVELDPAMTTPFENEIEELVLSPFLFGSGDEPPPASGTASATNETPEGFTFTFVGEGFTYTARGIQKA